MGIMLGRRPLITGVLHHAHGLTGGCREPRGENKWFVTMVLHPWLEAGEG